MSAPVKETCPLINRVIRDINDCLKIAAELEDKDIACRIDSCLYSTESDLEELRSANEQLRAWGTGLEEQVEALKFDKGCLDDEISSLEQKVIDLEGQIEYYEELNSCKNLDYINN